MGQSPQGRLTTPSLLGRARPARGHDAPHRHLVGALEKLAQQAGVRRLLHLGNPTEELPTCLWSGLGSALGSGWESRFGGAAHRRGIWWCAVRPRAVLPRTPRRRRSGRDPSWCRAAPSGQDDLALATPHSATLSSTTAWPATVCWISGVERPASPGGVHDRSAASHHRSAAGYRRRSDRVGAAQHQRSTCRIIPRRKCAIRVDGVRRFGARFQG